jgi:hypothetical protein
MKRGTLLIGILILVAALLAGCQSPEEQQKRRMLDSSIHVVQADFNNFYVLGTLPTPGRSQNTTARLTEDWTRVEGIAKNISGVDTSKAAAAHADLVQTVDSVAGEADGKLAMISIMPKLEAFKAAVDELHKSAGFSD